jgi:hypothetical protein
MKNTKSGLFSVKNLKNNDSIQETIAALRKEARSYQEINNTLVSKKWNLDIQIVRSKSVEEKNALREQQQDILSQIEEGGYVTKIMNLIDKIRDLEIEHYGHSDFERSSPHKI